MRKPILTPEQEAELAVVEAAWPAASLGERMALKRKLSVYAWSCQRLTEEDHRIMSRFPVRIGSQKEEDEDEDERWFARQASASKANLDQPAERLLHS